jgi:hypothetical protein
VNLLLPLLLAAGVHAQDPCNPPPTGLEDLASVFSLLYDYTNADTQDVPADPGGFCPDDLGRPIDMADADARADRLDQGDREAAAMLLAYSVATTDRGHVQALANAAALLDALLGAAMDDRDEYGYLVDTLLEMATTIDDPMVHRQIALNLWRRGLADDDERVKALVEEYMPLEPDYAKIFADGKTEVNVTLHTGSDGFKHSKFKEVFERNGAEVKEESNGDLTITYKIKPDDPALPEITWNITIRDAGWPPSGVMDQFTDDDVEVSMFGDHSQLGTSIDRALSRADESATSTDLHWMDACKSKVFASRLTQAFPKAHIIYTKDSEYFHDMPLALQRGMVALTNHYDYDEMERYIGRGSLYRGYNYIYPDDAGKLAYMDQDNDGIADSEDRVFDVDSPVDGELGSRAVHIANTYMGYSGAYGKSSEDNYRPDGIFDGPAGGPYTQITERRDAYGDKKYFVKFSDEVLGMDKSQRTASIAAEMARHYGVEHRWSEEKNEAGAFLVGAAVYDVWSGDGYDEFNDTYLSDVKVSKWDLGKHLDDHDFATSTKVREFQDYVREQREGSED